MALNDALPKMMSVLSGDAMREIPGAEDGSPDNQEPQDEPAARDVPAPDIPQGDNGAGRADVIWN